MRLNKLIRDNWWMILILLLAHFVQFWPFYLRHLLPFPGDMLVAFFFPWSGGGFTGFDPWTTYKALNTVDVIKQFYPWKDFAFDLLHHGIWPLWNPYSFSGMPFIANLQSGIFFPTNIIYLIVPTLTGWVTNILVQLLAFGLFFYLFLRSEKLSRLASVFGAVVGMNLSYITLWHWQLVITQSALFLPLILCLVNVYSQKKKPVYLLLISLLLSFCFLGGHAQTTIYVYLIFGFFAIYRRISIKLLILTAVLPVFIAAVQLVPSLEAYLLSAREGAASQELFAPFVFHWKNIITVLAPDFFGHPSSRNYVGTDYRDMNAYFGLTAFIFSVISLSWIRYKSSVRYFFIVAIIGLAFAAWPFVLIFDLFHVPVLSSGVPARMIFVFQFAGAVLAAYGFEFWLQKKSRHLVAIGVIGLAITILWILAIIDQGATGPVSRNNLILPTALFITTSAIIFFKRQRAIFISAIFILLFFQYSFFFNKYNSFAPANFVFPQHPAITYLQKNGGLNRFFGTEQAILNYNFSVYYHLYDFEGYDSMYPLRYGQLIASVKTGTIPQVIPRSDAYIQHWSDRLSERLLDILGVKYLLDKNDMMASSWDPQPGIFSPERYSLVWQQSKWRIFERKTALPRIGLFGSFIVEKNSEKIVEKIYDQNFDYQNQLILESSPAIAPIPTNNKKVSVISYQPNRVEIDTAADQPQLLYLSDNFYPGWIASVDGKNTSILRAYYTFRAIVLPAGNHKVVFQYDPISFKIGFTVSAVSIISLCGLILFLCKRKS